MPTYVALGDSITEGQYASRRISPGVPTTYKAGELDGTSYATLIAQHVGAGGAVEYLNLGTGGAFAFTVWNEELPKLPRRATLVTLSIGVNDELTIAGGGAFASGGLVLHPTTVYWQTALRRIVDGIRSAAPGARIVVANVPNLAFMPAHANDPADLRALLTSTAEAMNAVVGELAAERVTVVDLRCDPEVYRADRLSDAVHPNDAGYAHLAERFIAALDHPNPPAEHCPPYAP